ncbi:MAG TPA: hypothetical protein VK207_12530, partial [Bacteroidales bacterium]|nr:hypothetical protein [Bacteroidales bacterium]
MKTSFKKTSLPGILVFLVLLLFFTGGGDLYSQGVGISEAAIPDPHPSSILELRSTARGFLAPRMTTAQRLAIVNKANGLLVYDTDTKSFWYFDGITSTWKAFASGELGSSNQLLGMNATGSANEYKTLNGSANITVTHSLNNIDLNTIQDIQTISSPTFRSLTLNENLSVAGITTLNGAVTAGDAESDAVTIKGTVQPGTLISGQSALVFDGSTPDATNR